MCYVFLHLQKRKHVFSNRTLTKCLRTKVFLRLATKYGRGRDSDVS